MAVSRADEASGQSTSQRFPDSRRWTTLGDSFDGGAVYPRKWRIAMYSHDTMGLGHMRRNLLIASALACAPVHPVVLMLAGAREANRFSIPRGVDCLTLPALYKAMDGRYRSRHLDLSLKELTTLRSNTIHAALEAFEPDVLIVDKVPRGAVRELDPVLQFLRTRGHTRCVLGLRDVLDDPAAVRREWHHAANEDAIRDYYDAVWVYGDPTVYDLAREYRLSADVTEKIRYTGYLGPFSFRSCVEPSPAHPAIALPESRFVVCLVGGGQDGSPVAETFAELEFPAETYGVILMGPFMPGAVQQRIRQRAASNARLLVLDFIREPVALLRRAERVVAMGGYNTVCEALSLGKHTLVVPRVKPRCEQLIRAERLQQLGLLDVLHPDDLTPHALSDWLARNLGKPLRLRRRINLKGLARIPLLLGNLLTAPAASTGGELPNRGISYVAR